MQIKGLLLDLDGTLADTIPALKAVYHEFLGRRGAKGTDQEFWSLAGCSILTCMQALRDNHGIMDDAAELARDYYALVDDLYAAKAEPMPGARELLDHAQEQGIKVAVVTSSPAKVAADFLKSHGLEDLVQVIVGAGDTEQGKPHPQPFQEALGQFGLSPDEAIAVEDSEVGVQSAQAAGITTYQFEYGDSPDQVVSAVAGVLTRLDELIPVLAG